jgi:uncharacterized protein with HEPN domain
MVADCAIRIMSYPLDEDQSTFMQDEQLQDAVIRNIKVLGEAANNIKCRSHDLIKFLADI